MSSLLIFNPEHDFALACGRRLYTPPASVRALRRRLALTMLPLATRGDYLSVPDELPDNELRRLCGLREVIASQVILIRDADISRPDILKCIDRVIPWGWDHTLAASLRRLGIGPSLLKSAEELDEIRRLSHREISIEFNRQLALAGIANAEKAESFADPDSAMRFAELYPGAYFKAPWSSSGRGVARQGDLPDRRLREWLAGTIARQGSVLAETPAEKVLDFATEWDVDENEVYFRGLSLFCADSSGHYKGNSALSQKAILREIRKAVPSFGNELTACQRDILRRLLLGRYQGPVGIDMLADSSGNIRPCVEVNLRMTMGRIELEKTQKIAVIGRGNVASHLTEAFAECADTVSVNPRTLENLPDDADLYLISVSDKAIAEVASRMPEVGGIVAHTSGSIPIEALRGHNRRGVFYPLQTFTKGKPLNYREIPVYIEGCSAEVEDFLTGIASRISDKVRMADSQKRKLLHLASVFACNFTIRLSGIADQLLGEAGIEFADIMPLLKETVGKLETLLPADAQTGPAVRGDLPVIESHLEMLRARSMDKEAEIYRLISDSIAEVRDLKTKNKEKL